MSVINPDAALRHHRWTALEAGPPEMRTCAKCGGVGKVPRVTLGVTVAWMAVVTLVIGTVLAGLRALVGG